MTTGTTAATGALTSATGAGVGVIGANGTTVAGSATFSPVLMNSTPPPQATGSTGPALPTVVATGRPTVTSGTTTNSAMTTARTSALRTTATTNGTIAGSIRIESGTNGAITVTNISTP